MFSFKTVRENYNNLLNKIEGNLFLSTFGFTITRNLQKYNDELQLLEREVFSYITNYSYKYDLLKRDIVTLRDSITEAKSINNDLTAINNTLKDDNELLEQKLNMALIILNMSNDNRDHIKIAYGLDINGIGKILNATKTIVSEASEEWYKLNVAKLLKNKINVTEVGFMDKWVVNYCKPTHDYTRRLHENV